MPVRVLVEVLVKALVEASVAIGKLRQAGNLSLTQLWYTIMVASLSLDTDTPVVPFSQCFYKEHVVKSPVLGLFETMYYVFQNSLNFDAYVMGHGNLTSTEVIRLISLLGSKGMAIQFFYSIMKMNPVGLSPKHKFDHQRYKYHPNCGNRFHKKSGRVLHIWSKNFGIFPIDLKKIKLSNMDGLYENTCFQLSC